MGDRKIALNDIDDDHIDDNGRMAADTKVEAIRDATPSSIESSPEPEAVTGSGTQDAAPPQKRKGGRKPIYATSEERKQRNRQAQAAFRERRTEYIKQLEAQIKQNEESLSSLQQSHRSAADECLMLRYKNSLLERILLEKGIDVNAELQIKTGSPLVGTPFSHLGANTTPTSQNQTLLQRTAVQRQHARRSVGQQFLPKLAPGQSNADTGFTTASPQGVPTPSSHASSPTNVPVRSPMAGQHGVMTPPASAAMAHVQQSYPGYHRSQPSQQNVPFFAAQQHSPSVHRRPTGPAQNSSAASIQSSHSAASQYGANQPMPTVMPAGPAAMTATNNPNMAPVSTASYYPSPFQKHIDQLEQEYDTEQQSMLDHESDSQGPRHFPPPYQQQAQQGPAHQRGYYHQALQSGIGAGQSHQFPHQTMPQNTGGDDVPDPYEALNQSIDPNDPMLDADPFGLSASMHYPTSYSAIHE